MPQVELRDHIRDSQRFLSRTLVAAGAVLLGLLALSARLFYLQVLSHEHYTTLSQDNRVKLVPLGPTRGLIYDRNGVVLAQNRPSYSLEITPEKVVDMAATLQGLGQLVAITPADLERFQRLQRQKRRFESIPIRVRLTSDEAAQFAVHRHRFPGVDIVARLSRHYPEEDKTAHVLGYVGRISQRDLEEIDPSEYAGTSYIGKIGIEKTYETTLHGTVGMQQVEVNALGRVVRVLENQAPQPGQNLRLHIDVKLQEVAMAAFGERNGAAVAIDPRNGGVLALVSKPGFDPNLFVEGISTADYAALQKDPDKPLYNRALRGQYPPGSTVKPFMGLAGLETGAVNYDTTKYCPGFYQLPGHSHRYRDWKKTGHGPMDLDAAIVQSCDVYFYDLAREVGVDGLHQFLSQFSFGQRTGVDLVGERPGLLPSRDWKRAARREPWYPGETLIMGIGQGYFLTTPLQLAAATAAVANGGTFHEPRVVAAIEDITGQDAHPPEAAHRAIPIASAEHWEDVRKAMRHVVDSPRGTAKRIRSEAYSIAGKTGTAQVFTVAQDAEYNEEEIAEKLRDHALFIAYAPADDPQIAVAVIVEHGGHGGAEAAPIARQILDAYLLGGSS
ncbi:MAG: penicillin-binding protein 2 [Pseudomonadota bacterium]